MSMISITPYNDHEDGRIERLEAVSAQMIEKKLPILAIHDHKGTLYVNWLKKPRAWFIFGHFWVTDGRAEAAGR
jgi:hypothetical protein